MNIFLEEKEKLLNSIENNTPKHWKEYYKNVPLDCIFEDLIIDINEIKRLTEENKQLKGSLQTYEILLKANVEENQKLKADYGNKAQVERDLLEEENKQLKEKLSFDLQWAIKYDKLHKEIRKLKEQLQQKEDIINKARELLVKWGEEPDADMYMQIKEYKEHRELLEVLDNKGE